jgi:hypothetical protein
MRPQKRIPRSHWERGIRHEKFAALAVNNQKYVLKKIENFCHRFPRSHWNRGIRFRGLIETAGSELCKRLSRFSRGKRSHMQNGFRPWIRTLGGIVWWKKTEGRKSRDTVPLRRPNAIPIGVEGEWTDQSESAACYLSTGTLPHPISHAMSMVCERGWGGQMANSIWSIRSPHPFWNGFRTS